MSARTRLRLLLVPAALLAASTALAALGGTGQATALVTAKAGAVSGGGSWPYPNGDLANTRVARGTAISAANVSTLRQAWTFKLSGTAAAGVEGSGSFAMSPVVRGGVVYIQDLDANVYAISLATGALKWEYEVNTPEQTGPGPDGVAVSGAAVYGDTPTTVFALNAATGKPIWVDSNLLSAGQGTFEIQPQVANGRVYLASAYGLGPGGGVIVTLDARTGRLLWTFNTVQKQSPGVIAGGAGAGGAWETPLIGPDGSVTFGIGNPYQSPASAIAYPLRQLYTDSEVNLDAATGKLRWYYQAVPDDFKDYDMQASPIRAISHGVPVVIGGGKMGYVYEMNAKTGGLIWKTPVGVHNGHDDDSLLALEGKFTLQVPYVYSPGALGGVLTNMALAGNTVYVATLDVTFEFTNSGEIDGVPVSSTGGELEALNLATGKVEWDTKVSDLPLGAMTVANNLVFTTLVNGTLIAANRYTGAIVYQQKLPTSTNSPIAIAGNTVLVPAGSPGATAASAQPQLVAYSLP